MSFRQEQGIPLSYLRRCSREEAGSLFYIAEALHIQRVMIGVGKADYSASPPSEPYVRFSRIRLSGRWCYLLED